MIEAMYLACVLCPTDTVAAVGLVKEKYYPKLNAVLFGESVVNDAISILLFRAINNMKSDDDDDSATFTWSSFFHLLWEFMGLAFISIFIGIGFGLLICLAFKYMKSLKKNPVKEVSLVFLFGYISYLFAEMIEFSGIISMFCCGIIFSKYLY